MMKRLFFAALTLALMLAPTAFAADTQRFEDGLNGPTLVNSSLERGGAADYADGYRGRGLRLDGKYGLDLGPVDGAFSVTAMVNVSSVGGTKTVFFKNMGSKENENWTGVILAQGVPSLWDRASGWKVRDTSAQNCLNTWTHLAYTENNGAGTLYVNGEPVSHGEVNAAPGRLYLGVTYWSDDALTAVVDELSVFDTCLSAAEVRAIADGLIDADDETLFENYEFPSYNLVDDLDLSAVPGGEEIAWSSSDEAVLSRGGAVTRPSENTDVTLTGRLGGVTREFKFTVLAGASHVNDEVILSYSFAEGGASPQDVRPSGYIPDESGNGNHGVVYGGMVGGVFDGADDYVQMPNGVLSGHDKFSIVISLTPDLVKTNMFTFCFGNGTDEYFFLNTSRPDGNLRAAITTGSYKEEKDVVHTPGIRSGERADIVITADGGFYKMYLNGELVSAADLGTAAADLGETTMNYLAKSPYNDPLFKGEINEFTIYSRVMDDDEVYAAFGRAEPQPSGGEYITDIAMDESLKLEFSRFCMAAVSLYGENGALIKAATLKVSDDDLTAELSSDGAVCAEVAAFDAATGIVKDRVTVSRGSGLVACARNGGSLTVANFSGENASAAVMIAAYDGDKLKSADITTVPVAASGFVVLPVNVPEGSRLLVWRSANSLVPLASLSV